MKCGWQVTAKVLTGVFVAALCAKPQATISARPGVLNYMEGHVFIDGHETKANKLKGVALYANQTLSTDLGRAEMLLTPGVFLRIGHNSAVRLISPSLVHTQFEVVKGEAMIEASEIVKDSSIQAVEGGTLVTIEKTGLYSITADNPPTVSVFDGKALVQTGTDKQQVKKGREMVLAANAKPAKFDRKQKDELYAWSNIRSEYAARASYASARTAAAAGNVYGGSGLGFSRGINPGWYYNNPLNSWAWLPGDGYAFSPFGYGFFSPGYVGYAPLILGGGGYPGWSGYRYGGHWRGAPVNTGQGQNSAAGMMHGGQGSMPGRSMPSGGGSVPMGGGGHMGGMGAAGMGGGHMGGGGGSPAGMGATHGGPHGK